MAALKPREELQGEQPNPRATSMAGYNSNIDAVRDKEFPMLQGRLSGVQILGARHLRILQERPISTTQAQLYIPSLSLKSSPKT